MGVLDGKVAIVTGGSRGIGAATVRGYVREGADVVFADIADERSEKLAAELGGRAMAVRADVSNEDDWEHLVATTLDRFGRVDVLANVAATMYMGLIVDTPLVDFLRVLNTNAAGTFLGIRAVAPSMTAAGSGSIINYASLGVFSVMPNISAYLASKQAVRALTHAAAMELGPAGIRTNTVCGPGGNLNFTNESPKSATMEAQLSGGAPTSEQVERSIKQFESMAVSTDDLLAADWSERSVPTMVFLASDASLGYNGADFVLDGGQSIGTTEFPG